ncbi:EpsG family protein [Acinetobacter sp. A2]|uniref:EpsG family protein n=1 Tax=Acinetobacter sp. A2 TaxID=362457 RepID=UPI003AF3A15A
MIIRFKTLNLIWVCIISSLLGYFISHRPRYLTDDYDAYEIMFENFEISSELTFNLIRLVLRSFDLDFIYLLFIYGFFSIFFKSLNLYKYGFLNCFIFFLFYFISFFPLWEMTQIRIGLAMSLFIYSITLSDFHNTKKNLFLIISILFHYSMIFVIFPYFLYFFLKKDIFKFSIVSVFSAILINLIFSYTNYSLYDVNLYSAHFSIFSLKIIFLVFLMIVCLKVIKSNFSLLSFSLSFFLLVSAVALGGKFPVVSIRLSDLSLFVLMFSVIFSVNNFNNFLLKIFLVLIVCCYYVYSYYLSYDNLVNLTVLKEWLFK